MTSPGLLRQRLDFIEAAVGDLRRLARGELIETDLRERRFIEHTLQIAIQAAMDAAAHVVASERLGSPTQSQDSFELLLRHGWIPPRLLGVMRQAVGFRNVLVHGYAEVDLRILRDVLDHRLDDLVEFVQAIRSKLQG